MKKHSEINADAIDFVLIDTIPGKTDKLILNPSQRIAVLKKMERIHNNSAIRGRIEIMGIERIT